MIPRRGLLLIAVLIAIGVGTLPAQTNSDTAKEIARIRDQWVANWNAKYLDPIVKVFEEDAVLLPSTGQRIVGRGAIEAYLKQTMDSNPGKLSVRSVNVKESGNLAYDRGTFQYSIIVPGTTLSGNVRISGNVTISGGGGQRQVKGNYLSVYKHGPDHKWFIQRLTVTQTMPPQH